MLKNGLVGKKIATSASVNILIPVIYWKYIIYLLGIYLEVELLSENVYMFPLE